MKRQTGGERGDRRRVPGRGLEAKKNKKKKKKLEERRTAMLGGQGRVRTWRR